MTYKQFKKWCVYIAADVVELYDENGIEIDDSIPEEELDEMYVKVYSVMSGWLSLVLVKFIPAFTITIFDEEGE